MNVKREFFQTCWNLFRPEIAEYSFLDRPDALRSNLICNSSALALTTAVRSAVVATRQVFQVEDFVQWVLLATKGTFVYTPERLTRYRVHSASASYLISEEYLRYFYSLIEMLLTLHALTDDPGLRASAESELLCTWLTSGTCMRKTFAVGVPIRCLNRVPPREYLTDHHWGIRLLSSSRK